MSAIKKSALRASEITPSGITVTAGPLSFVVSINGCWRGKYRVTDANNDRFYSDTLSEVKEWISLCVECEEEGSSA